MKAFSSPRRLQSFWISLTTRVRCMWSRNTLSTLCFWNQVTASLTFGNASFSRVFVTNLRKIQWGCFQIKCCCYRLHSCKCLCYRSLLFLLKYFPGVKFSEMRLVSQSLYTLYGSSFVLSYCFFKRQCITPKRKQFITNFQQQYHWRSLLFCR